MRMAFGLAGLLVTLGVIVVLMSMFHPADTVKRGEKAKDQVRQIAGVDSEGHRASDSISLEPQLRGGQLRNVLVVDIDPDGPMARYFGLKRNDSIIQVGPLTMDFLSDGETAKAHIYEAYQRQQPLVVMRDGQQITLPQEPQPGSPPQPAAAPAAQSPLQRQLDAISGPRQ